ncbi:MAG: hypothetical protein IBX69_09705 [Anaerolineales bacterium]|nr:hypothetical protein [Anaerolineales bacterium]
MRWILFLITLLLGVVLGLLYGWVVKPSFQVGSTPDSLRSDYQADMVLMVAEAYQVDGDLVQVVRRLAPLGENPPGEHLQRAIALGTQIGFSSADIELLEILAADLRDWDPAEVRDSQ